MTRPKQPAPAAVEAFRARDPEATTRTRRAGANELAAENFGPPFEVQGGKRTIRRNKSLALTPRGELAVAPLEGLRELPANASQADLVAAWNDFVRAARAQELAR